MTAQSFEHPMTALPDPTRQPEFYDGVTAKRLIAWFIDSALIVLLVIVILPFTGFLGIFVLPMLYLVIGFAYRVVTLTGGSATWGMRIMAVEIRRMDGSRLDLGTAFLHTLGYTVSFGIFLVQVVSVVLMLTSSYGQGLTDHVLGTVGLNKRR